MMIMMIRIMGWFHCKSRQQKVFCHFLLNEDTKLKKSTYTRGKKRTLENLLKVIKGTILKYMKKAEAFTHRWE